MAARLAFVTRTLPKQFLYTDYINLRYILDIFIQQKLREFI
jgi:hypothetical protein